MDFKCEPGKWLSDEEARDMLAYDNAKIRRPAAYNDVIFDNTSGTRAGFRCKTQTEVDRAEQIAAAEQATAEAARERRARVLSGAGIDPATGVAVRPAAFNTAVDLNPQQDEGGPVTAGGVAPVVVDGDDGKAKKDK